MQSERRAYADTPLGPVHYRVQGAGTPVLLIHQTPWFAVEFEHAVPPLVRAGYATIAPDTPGFGYSPTPAGRPTLVEYADALVAVLDAAGAARAMVVGHHTGAGLAALLAARHPDRVRCVVLHGVPLYSEAERGQKLAAVTASGVTLAPDGSHLSRHYALVREKIMHGEGTLEGVQWSTLAYFLASDREMKAYRALFEFDAMERTLRSIRVPALLLVDADDMLLGATRRARELQPSFRYEELPGGGSHVIYDRPGEWTGAVLRFARSSCGATGDKGER
jgi:pimeloyl-ACP methyl ester carboxylesterase